MHFYNSAFRISFHYCPERYLQARTALGIAPPRWSSLNGLIGSLATINLSKVLESNPPPISWLERSHPDDDHKIRRFIKASPCRSEPAICRWNQICQLALQGSCIPHSGLLMARHSQCLPSYLELARAVCLFLKKASAIFLLRHIPLCVFVVLARINLACSRDRAISILNYFLSPVCAQSPSLVLILSSTSILLLLLLPSIRGL